MQDLIVDNAKVMPKGQITLPKDIRDRMGVGSGDRLTLVCEGDKVYLMNSEAFAERMLKKM